MAATSMAKSSTGPATRHILASHGPTSYQYDFYATTYSTQHGAAGKPLQNTGKTTFRHKGTGYSANFRPAVYYDRKADLMEFPNIANLLGNVYSTSSSRDYTAQPLNTGYEQLPSVIRLGPSGYTHNLPVTCELYKHHVSSNTIYRGEYPQKEFRKGSLTHSERSNKEVSGYSHAVNIEPITYRPTECHNNDLPGYITWRPTGHTIMKEDFKKTPLLSGHESLPMATERGNKSNGYIKGHSYPALAQPIDIKGPTVQDLHPKVVYTKRKCDPAHFSTITHPGQYTAFKSIVYTPQGIHPHNKPNTTGKQELSGYSDNTLPHFNSTQPAYYITSTGNNFSTPPIAQLPEPTDSNTARPILPDGFTKSTRVHSLGSQYNPVQTLRAQHPYVAKSILVHDPCFVDLTYQSKKRVSK